MTVSAHMAWRSAAVLLLAALLTACNGPGGISGKDSFSGNTDRAGDEVAARVNGTTIYASDVAREAAAQKLIQVGDPLPKDSKIYKQVLDNLVDQRLLALEAVRRELDRSSEAKRRLQAARERILGNILVENVVSQAVTDDAVRRMYDEQAKLSPPEEEVKARHILVKTKKEAEAIEKALAGGADFAKLAKEKSLDPGSRLRGGDLGYFTHDAMVAPFADAAFALKKGEISPPVQTQFGWHIIKLEDRRKQKAPSFDEMRPRIVRFMTFDEIQKLISQLRLAAIIERDDEKADNADADKATPPAASASSEGAAGKAGKTGKAGKAVQKPGKSSKP